MEGTHPLCSKNKKNMFISNHRGGLRNKRQFNGGVPSVSQREFAQRQHGPTLVAAWRKIPMLLWAPQDECCD